MIFLILKVIEKIVAPGFIKGFVITSRYQLRLFNYFDLFNQIECLLIKFNGIKIFVYD